MPSGFISIAERLFLGNLQFLSMERDFMGLSSKRAVGLDKRELSNDCKEEAGLGQAPSFPNLISCGLDQADNFYKTGSTKPLSFVPNVAESQTLLGLDANGKILGGIPVTTAAQVFPSNGGLGGARDPWNGITTGKWPAAQLTIFYAGTVNVFNDVTPEKAQAIMLMAGSMSSKPPLPANPAFQIQERGFNPTVAEGLNPNPLLSSGIPSPISVSSHPVAPAASGTSEIPDPMAEKLGFSYAASMIPSIPQARKASLARFLEKRKERLMNAAPYNMGMKAVKEEECFGMSYSATSAA